MFNQLVGLLLFALGIKRNTVLNPNVRGDATAAAQQTGILTPNSTFRLDPKNFELRPPKNASGTGEKRQALDSHAFGMEISRVQKDFVNRLEVSSVSAQQAFTSHAADLRKQLTTVKNAQKQTMVERVSTNCQLVNVKRTAKMSDMLDKLSTLLTKISDRAASASASGKDTSNVESAITTAQSAIADAQLSVAGQAGKTCTISITTEQNLKTDVGKTISSLEADLRDVYSRVIVARKAVGDAIGALFQVIGEPRVPVITPAHASPSGNEPG